MTRCLLLFALVGCTSGYEPPREDLQPKEPAPEPKTVTFRAAARDGEAKAAIASFPRKDWPCAIRFKNLNDEVITRRIAYDRTSCTVPAVRLHSTYGGCPRDATYDAQGRLLTIAGQEFVWGKSGPVTRDIDDERKWKFGMLGGDVATGSDKSIDEIARLDASGRVVGVDQVKQRNVVAAAGSVFILPVHGIELAWSTTLVYDGARITRLKFHGEHSGDSESELLYDCSALPPDEEPGNAAPGADSTKP